MKEYRAICRTANSNTPLLDGVLLHTYYPLHIKINHKYFYLYFNLLCVF